LILVAFLFPVAVYLLVLGGVNRRRHPLLVSGVWDFIGVLAASSGFLLLGGPAALSSASERWRTYWLLGGSPGEGAFWVLLSVVYFVVVVAGAGFVLWYQRHLTAVYNVSPALLEEALAEVFERLGLRPVRTGNLFVFGMPLGKRLARPRSEGIQGPHLRPGPAKEPPPDDGPSAERTDAPPSDLAAETAVLEVSPFPRMWHATLRWDPPAGNLRRQVEAELGRTLAEVEVPDHELSAWLTLTGFTLMGLTILGLILLLIFNTTGH
jgi:hypothetical protein